MNIYEESDYGVISLLIGVCAIGSIFWWYISIPCALLTILLAYLAKDANSKMTCVAGLIIGATALFMSIAMCVYLYNEKIDNMLDEISPSSLKNKISSEQIDE